MKIGLIVPSLSYDDTVSTPTIRLLAESLGATDGVELHAFALRYPPSSESGMRSSITLHAIGGATMRVRTLLSTAVQTIRAEHTRSGFDVLHAIWLHEPGLVATIAGRLLRVPVVASIGGAEVARLPDIGYGGALHRRGRLMSAYVMRRAGIVTGGSEYILSLARPMVSKRTALHMVPLPVDTQLFQPVTEENHEPCGRRLLHAASLIPVKDQAMLLRAFQIVANRFPDTTLTIAGEDPFGHRAGLETLSDALGLSEKVHFLGAVPHAAMPPLYHSADIFMLSSRHESQGMVVLEAAASGLPTVGTGVGVVPDLGPSAAVAVPVSDHTALATATTELLEDPLRCRRMGSAARERVVRDYAVQPVIERLQSLFADVAGNRRL